MARWPASRRRATSATAGARSQPSKWRPRAPRQAAARRPGPDFTVFRAFPCPATRRLHVLRCLSAAVLRRCQGAQARRYADGRRHVALCADASPEAPRIHGHGLRGTRRQSARPGMTAARTPIHELAECSIPSGCGADGLWQSRCPPPGYVKAEAPRSAVHWQGAPRWPCADTSPRAPRIRGPWVARHTAPVSAR
jgi:hypothetical protein